MKHPKPVSDNVDEYLEEMYRRESKGEEITTKGLASALEISMPSVSQMLAKLKRAGYVEHEPRRQTALTAKGRSAGKTVYSKHETLKKFLLSLGFGEKKAEQEACRLEHAVSEELEQALRKRI